MSFLNFFEFAEGGGGLAPGVTYTILKGGAFVMHTAANNSKWVMAKFPVKAENGDKKGEELDFAVMIGSPDGFEILEGGQQLKALKGPIWTQCSFARFVESLFKEGWPEDKRDFSAGVGKTFEGLSFVAGQMVTKADGAKIKKDQTDTIAEKVVAWPWGANKGGSSKKDTGSSKSGDKGKNGGDDTKAIDALARECLEAIIKEDGSTKQGSLRGAIRAYLNGVDKAEHFAKVNELSLDDSWMNKNLPKVGLKLEDGKVMKDED